MYCSSLIDVLIAFLRNWKADRKMTMIEYLLHRSSDNNVTGEERRLLLSVLY